ncbi:MAG: rRNA pseudouridine synthase [Candidatus Dormibacteraeota bacterium]|nr:rRNA pseudouridine synthase [Candidatus Dormibacteraeota bacterium]
MESERLNRYLARRGVASRRTADELIAAGRVEVNGQRGLIGTVVAPDRDRVAVDGREVGSRLDITLALNKPAGVVTTVSDPQHRRTVMQLVQPVPGLVPVGRLDADSRGLLLLTTDGELAHRVTHPRHGVRKRYRVRVRGEARRDPVEMLARGVALDDGPARELRARAVRGGVEIEVGEGRKREVRRMCAAVGLEVWDLVRVAVGPVSLGDLTEGASRSLTGAELRDLRQAVGLNGE